MTVIMKNCDCCCDLPLSRLKGGDATNGQILLWDAAAGEWLPRDLTLDKIAQSGATDGQIPTWREGGWVAETLPEPPPEIPLVAPYLEGDVPSFEYTQDEIWGFKSSGLSVVRNPQTNKAVLSVKEPGETQAWGTLRFSGDISLPEDLASLIPQALGAPKSVTGSRSGGTALTNLLAALDQLGLIDDQTTA